MTVNFAGVVSVVFFYIIILVVGIWAGKKKTPHAEGEEEHEAEEVMLAGRNIGIFVGIFTMTATWVGGGYINGTAEVLYSSGVIWCVAPFGYAASLVVGGYFFATKMREEGYVTMLDPFQEVLGSRMGGLLFLPALCGEIFWSAAILAALGATVSVIIDMDNNASIILSAIVALVYTLFGGLYSVAYTDVIQLFCIFIGLWLCIPFSLNNPAVKSMSSDYHDWFGTLPPSQIGQYLDSTFLLILGGVPWQVYFQRVLSTKTARKAQILSYVAAFGCLIMAIPPMIIGAIGRVTAWNETAFTGPLPLDASHTSLILPMVLQYLTPPFVSFVGLGAVSAAVMSSSDSSLLSASSMFARNVYKLIIRQNASEHEVVWVMKISIVIVGAIATYMALTVHSIYGLWYLSSDLVYVILFPQLVCVVHFKHHCNTYGSLAGFIVGLFLRAGGGEDILHLPPIIKYPFYDEESGGQLFPFRTFAMLSSFTTLLAVTKLSKWLFHSHILPPEYDYFNCVVNIPDDVVVVQDPEHPEEHAALNMAVISYQSSNGQVNAALETDDCDSHNDDDDDNDDDRSNDGSKDDDSPGGNHRKSKVSGDPLNCTQSYQMVASKDRRDSSSAGAGAGAGAGASVNVTTATIHRNSASPPAKPPRLNVASVSSESSGSGKISKS